jgi:uncharacterized membrane protein YkoI
MFAPMKFVLRNSAGLSHRRALLRALLFACTMSCIGNAVAQTMTSDEAVARARAQVPGKLVAVNKERQGERTVYRVRILGADGVVRTVFIDADR